MTTTRLKTIRKAVVILAVLAALLSTHAVGLANNDLAQVDDRGTAAGEVSALYELGVVNGTVEIEPDDVIVFHDEPAAAKPGVSIWGKCQVPGKCEIGLSIKIRF